jgi:hypothetical protein
MATELQGYSGVQVASVDAKSAIQDFLKIEYTPGLINEFNTREALINRLAKDTITGKKKYKTFALGVTDAVRALNGSEIGSDLYQIGLGDFIKGGDKVDAEFDTVKIMGVFSITDETILKGTTDGSLYDVLKDTLDRMNLSLKHTQSRYTYGSKSGLIGVIKTAEAFTDLDTAPGVTHPAVQVGSKQLTGLWKITMSNPYLLLPGQGIMLRTKSDTQRVEHLVGTDPAVVTNLVYANGYVWQEDSSVLNERSLIIKVTGPAGQVVSAIEAGVEVFAAQLGATVAQEYTGLHDILINQNTKVFGVDRTVYRSLRSPQKNMQVGGVNQILTEEVLRDMADHLELTMPEQRGINLVAAPHRVISAVEKSMLQFKQYQINQDPMAGFQLGRPTIKFDNYELYKDKYAHDNTVYMLDTQQIGELLRKDFGWLTSGREGILERRDGTEVYEAIMTKYGDMYVDAWKCHASFVNVATDAPAGE